MSIGKPTIAWACTLVPAASPATALAEPLPLLIPNHQTDFAKAASHDEDFRGARSSPFPEGAVWAWYLAGLDQRDTVDAGTAGPPARICKGAIKANL